MFIIMATLILYGASIYIYIYTYICDQTKVTSSYQTYESLCGIFGDDMLHLSPPANTSEDQPMILMRPKLKRSDDKF
jgi:hypothetical protein